MSLRVREKVRVLRPKVRNDRTFKIPPRHIFFMYYTSLFLILLIASLNT